MELIYQCKYLTQQIKIIQKKMSVTNQKAQKLKQATQKITFKRGFSNKDLAAMVGEKVLAIKKCMHADGYTNQMVYEHLMNLIRTKFYRDQFTGATTCAEKAKMLASNNTFHSVIEHLIKDRGESCRQNLYRILQLLQIEYGNIKINRKEDAFVSIQSSVESSTNNQKQSSKIKGSKQAKSPLKQSQLIMKDKDDRTNTINSIGTFKPSSFKPSLVEALLQLTKSQASSGEDFASLSQALMKAEMLKVFLQEKMALAEVCKRKLDILKRAQEQTNDRDSCNEYEQLVQ